MNENHVTVNSGKAFLLAARPKTLSGAAVPVMIGVALAIHDMGWERFVTPLAGDWYRMPLVPALLCFLFAMVMQVDANFVNDYFDCVRGKDDRETRLGPKRACTEGWVTLPAMRRCLVVTTALACLVGLPLVCFGGWEMVLVGAACVLFCFLYTTLLAQHGMGDVLVLLFFGLVPVCLTYYVTMPPASQTITAQVVWASLACGLVIDTLLVVNNYRDYDQDRAVGKKTLIVRIGRERAEQLYGWLGNIATYMMWGCLVLGDSSFVLMLVCFACFVPYALLHGATRVQMRRIGRGKELNKVLGMTARNMFVFGVTTAIVTLFIL